ncbi:ClpP/crotonase [Coprinopsis marcescibilis]|uniref:ClpP/crotonase n=1 Tax=Coprinopsis marcescibilis TaxID=230819 RepID=A0A5C3KMI8_COPMA|nr:ClpP/crotonase [Coprinopsis marcescibilis]
MPSVNPPNTSNQLLVSFPSEHVLLLTLNRPKQLNAMTPQLTEDLRKVLNWFEEEPSLWVVIVTGAGRVFCAGADLKAWNNDQQQGVVTEQEGVATNPYGFGSISRRQSRKPFIAAVAGGAYGGGLEMVLNCDYVIASEDAKFALPEVKRGVIAIQGGIPRLSQIAGHQLASELLLLGKTISADEAHRRFGFVNQVVPGSDSVLRAAAAVAEQMNLNSPDAVQATKRALVLAQEFGHSEMLTNHVWGPESKRTYRGENIKEGLRAFAEKRTPRWTSPAKL